MSTTTVTLKPCDVIRYQSDRAQRGERDAYWCLEGIAIVREDGAAFDTFWQSGSEAHRLSDSELTTAEVQFNLNDYDELDRHRPGARMEWEKYREDQRQMVTSQHRLQARYFVLKGTQPDLEQQIANAYDALQKAHEDLRSAGLNVEWKAHELARLEAQR